MDSDYDPDSKKGGTRRGQNQVIMVDEYLYLMFRLPVVALTRLADLLH